VPSHAPPPMFFLLTGVAIARLATRPRHRLLSPLYRRLCAAVWGLGKRYILPLLGAIIAVFRWVRIRYSGQYPGPVLTDC
jgi:hypothetical protein